MTRSFEQHDCLSSRAGKLFVDELDAQELVRRFGSPLFVFSETQLRSNVSRFRDSFERGWSAGPVKVMPAVKANWTLAAQRVLADEGCGADVYSAGELDVALRAGMEPRHISVNGVPKQREHIERTVEVGARLTIDSLRDVEILEQMDPGLRSGASVRLRLRPALSDFTRASQFAAEGLVPTDLVALVYKGGLSFEEVVEAGRRLKALEGVELVGFHQHHGRHRPSLSYWAAQMRAYARDIGRVCRALGGLSVSEISIGGGFAIPRDPHNAATNYTDPILFAALYAISGGLRLFGEKLRYRAVDRLLGLVQSRPNQHRAPSIEAYAEICTTTLLEALGRHGVPTKGLMLQLEPGRSVHGNAGVHLTTVEAVKKMRAPIGWNHITVDTSEFWLTGGRFEHHLHDYCAANRMNDPATIKADVVGRSCYGDRLLGAVRLPDLQVGDLLALLDTGAYQEVSASNFNAMPRPAAVMVNGSEACVIRRAENLEDVFARDQLPAHLERKAPTSEARLVS